MFLKQELIDQYGDFAALKQNVDGRAGKMPTRRLERRRYAYVAKSRRPPMPQKIEQKHPYLGRQKGRRRRYA